MAFTGNFLCSSFKVDILCARHNFLLSGGSTFRIALYTNSASFTAAQTQYVSTNEIPNGSGYVTKGNALTRIDPIAAVSPITTAIADFADSLWASSTITNARGALVYNDDAVTPVIDASVCVLDFLADKSSVSGDFTVIFPAADGTNAIIRIA
jgi:hypothetical protein